MNNREIASIIDATQECLETIYIGNTEKIISNSDDDIVYIGDGDKPVLFGKHKFMEETDSIAESGIKYTLKNQKFKCIFSSKNSVVIIGIYFLVYTENKKIYVKKQRATIVWAYENKKWQIMHIHISAPSEAGQAAELTEAGGVTDDVLKTAKGGNKIVVKDTEGNRHFITEDEIVYVEADNMNSVLYCQSESFTLRLTLKEIFEMLTENFVRVHKSYIVNKSYVCGISRYSLRMANDIEVPVSKERYMELKGIFKAEKQEY